jgi:hypothetical protein
LGANKKAGTKLGLLNKPPNVWLKIKRWNWSWSYRFPGPNRSLPLGQDYIHCKCYTRAKKWAKLQSLIFLRVEALATKRLLRNIETASHLLLLCWSRSGKSAENGVRFEVAPFWMSFRAKNVVNLFRACNGHNSNSRRFENSVWGSRAAPQQSPYSQEFGTEQINLFYCFLRLEQIKTGSRRFEKGGRVHDDETRKIMDMNKLSSPKKLNSRNLEVNVT